MSNKRKGDTADQAQRKILTLKGSRSADQPAPEEDELLFRTPALATDIAAPASPSISPDLADTGSYPVPEFPHPSAEDEDSGEALASLQHLEKVIRDLHHRWTEVEGELAARDSEVARLEEDRAIQHAAFRSLMSERDQSNAKISTLENDIERLQDKLRSLQADSAQHDEQLAAQVQLLADCQAELAAAEQRHREALEVGAGLEEQLQARAREFEARQQDTAALHQTISDLRVKAQELEAYIDRRKTSWDKLNSELDDYRDALAGMEITLQQKDQQIRAQSGNEQGLNETITRLQQRCAELDGRRSERESENKELQARLLDHVGRMEKLQTGIAEAEARRAKAIEAADQQRSKLEAARAEISQLQGKLAEVRADAESGGKALRAKADREIAEIRSSLDLAHKEGARLQESVADNERRMATLQSQLAEERAKFENLWEAATDSKDKLEELTAEKSALQNAFDEQQQAMASLEAEYTKFRHIAELDLEISAQRIEDLESEVRSKSTAMESLNRNVRIVDELNASAQRLDRQMSSSSARTPRAEPVSGGSEIRRLMVAIQGQKKIRYPIYKESMTIGRLPENDIQVCHKWISRQHARIVINDGLVVIEDLSSKNGIRVNDALVQTSPLKNHDMVEIGEMRFEFLELPGSSASEAETAA